MKEPMSKKDEVELWEEHYEQAREIISGLTFEEARRLAELLLADPLKFECASSPSAETISILAPGLQSVFSRFESIHVVDDEAYLSRREIELFDRDGDGKSWGQPLWKIGCAQRHSVALVRPHDERVFDMNDDELGEPYPSIFHWLVWVSALASDFCP